jgi:hypothetical protein
VWLDVDGDSDADLLSSTASGPQLWPRDAALTGDCNVGNLRGVPVSSFGVMRAIAAADVDGDGDADVIAVTSGGVATLLLSNSTGAFANVSSSRGFLSGTRCSGVTVLDADGDGDVDVFLACTLSTSMLLLNNGSGFFTDGTSRLAPNRAGEFAAAVAFDGDGDGDVDLLVAAVGSNNRMYMNNGTGFFTDDAAARNVSTNTAGVVWRSVTAADVDGDGDVDVHMSGNVSSRLLLNNGSAGFVTAGVAAGLAFPGATVLGSAFGDVDQDGDVDALVSMQAPNASVLLLNNGAGVFASSGGAVWVDGAAVFMDADGDGDLDAPTLGFDNGVVPAGFIGVGIVAVRVVSRSGVRSCHGAVVRLYRSGGGLVATRVVDGATSVYDVLVAVGDTGAQYDVEVVFPSGRRHSKATQTSLGAVALSTLSSLSVPRVTVRDVPAIVNVTVPTGTILGAGGSVTVVVTALGGERGLVASPVCAVNGVNVTATAVDLGSGAYRFTYTVNASHTNSPSVAMRFALVDPRVGAVSGVWTLPPSSGPLAVDTRAPLVSFNATPGCTPDNNTATAVVNQTVCISCGSVADEPNGCNISVSVNGSAAVNYTADAQNSVGIVVGPLSHGQKGFVRAWARDAAGNVGAAVVWTWEVDLHSPVTLWTPQDPPPYTNATSLTFVFGCSETVRECVCVCGDVRFLRDTCMSLR